LIYSKNAYRVPRRYILTTLWFSIHYLCSVNFLSHYHFDHQKDNPEYNLGLIFPDLLRNFVRGSKLKLGSKEPSEKQAKQLHLGCVEHVASDKIFHAWEGFHEGMADITRMIRTEDIGIRKDWFIAHILFELTMDYYLINRDGSLASNLYTDFGQVDTKTMQHFLELHDFDNFDKVMNGFNRFMEVQYLESYTRSESIVFALGKICTKMKLEPFTEKQKFFLNDVVIKLNEKMPTWVERLEVELT